MTPTTLGPLLRQIRKILDPSHGANVSDAELLERFVGQRDEAAFELLVWRHQRMVLGVCRRVLRDTHEAEDAFQAAFLALARKADFLRQHRAVAGWLHTVAYHIALRARKKTAKRRSVDVDSVSLTCLVDPSEEAMRRDLAAILDEEVSRLPEKYRLPIVLCYLQGKTYPEASRQLGVPVGTLSARLTKARDILRMRLLHRGVGMSGAFLAAVLSEQAVRAGAPTAMVNSTVHMAVLMVRGEIALSTTLATLTEGALRSMFMSKLKITALVLLAGMFVTGIGFFLPAAAHVQPAVPIEPAQSHPITAAEKAKSARVDPYGDPLPDGVLFRFGSVRRRHEDVIRASALSPDGKILATASDHSVALWDPMADKPLRRFRFDRSGTLCTPGLCFSPDGQHLGFVQSWDFACVWEVKSGKRIAEFAGDARHAWSNICQFTPHGKQFILEDEKRLCFWDLQANRETRSLHVENVLLLSGDARISVHTRPNQALTFSDTQTGKKMGALDVAVVNNGIENGIAFAPDGKALAVVHHQKEIQVWTFPDRRLQFSVPLPDSAKDQAGGRDYWEYRLFFASDGRTLLLGTKNGLVHRWDLATGKELPPLSKHLGAVAGVHTLPDDKTLVTTGADGLIRRWDRRTGRELSEPPGYAGRIHAAYSADGRFVAVGDQRGRLELWNARNGRLLRVLQREGAAVTGLRFTPDTQSLAAAQEDNTVHFRSIPASKEQRVLHCGKEQSLRYLWDMRFSPDGNRLLIADHNYQARLWDVRHEKSLWGGRSGRLAFAPDGKTVLTQFAGPYLNAVDAATGKVRDKIRLNSNFSDNFGGINTVAYSPDGQRIAASVYGGEVYLCDVNSGVEIKHFLAADAPKGRIGRLLKERTMRAEGLSFSPDSRWLCTGGSDGSVRLYEAISGNEVIRFHGHEGNASEISFGADSRTVLSHGKDAQTYLWTLRPPREQEAKPSLDSLWAALADEPAKAYRALWAMSEDEDVAAFLRNKLVPVEPVANERLRKLIADLDSSSFIVRESATKSLAELGEVAAPAMREALTNNPALEMRKRLEELIQRIERKTFSRGERRILRAIDVLERRGNGEARELLKALAGGAPGALPSVAAQAVLKRLRQ